MNNQLPPSAIEAEELILGGILFDPRALSRIADILPSEAFYVFAHQKIYQAALELYHKNEPTDIMTVSNRLSDHNELEKLGGMARLGQLLERTVSAANIDRYAEIVLDKYLRRQLITASLEINELSSDTTLELEEVFQQSQSKVFEITVNQQSRFQPESIGDCLAQVYQQLEGGTIPSYSTGLSALDDISGGLFKQDLIVVAARASMGKTWFGCHLANQVVSQYQLPVVFFSAEMSKPQISKRFLAMHSGIDSSRLMRNIVYEDEWDNLVKASGILADLPIIIDDTPASLQNPARMRSALRKIRTEKGQIGLVVMDYIQKLGDRAAGNRAQAIGKFSGSFKDIAKEFEVPFVALAQINRGVEGQTNKRPLMSDIKDSGDIEQDADLILLLYRDEYYHPDPQDKGIMEINIGKNRNGATGVTKVQFNPMIGLISGL
jgi:replicative DNA helicase